MTRSNSNSNSSSNSKSKSNSNSISLSINSSSSSTRMKSSSSSPPIIAKSSPNAVCSSREFPNNDNFPNGNNDNNTPFDGTVPPEEESPSESESESHRLLPASNSHNTNDDEPHHNHSRNRNRNRNRNDNNNNEEEEEDEDDDVPNKKGAWSKEEDELLLTQLNKYQRIPPPHSYPWSEVARFVPGRTAKQCRERFVYNLDPAIKKVPWTPKEDCVLLHAQKELGNSWARIASCLPGRTENSTKTRFKSIIRARKRAFTEKEDQLILELYDKYTNGGTIRSSSGGSSNSNSSGSGSSSSGSSNISGSSSSGTSRHNASVGNKQLDKWALITQHLPGRTKNAVKTRHRALTRGLDDSVRLGSPDQIFAASAERQRLHKNEAAAAFETALHNLTASTSAQQAEPQSELQSGMQSVVRPQMQSSSSDADGTESISDSLFTESPPVSSSASSSAFSGSSGLAYGVNTVKGHATNNGSYSDHENAWEAKVAQRQGQGQGKAKGEGEGEKEGEGYLQQMQRETQRSALTPVLTSQHPDLDINNVGNDMHDQTRTELPAVPCTPFNYTTPTSTLLRKRPSMMDGEDAGGNKKRARLNTYASSQYSFRGGGLGGLFANFDDNLNLNLTALNTASNSNATHSNFAKLQHHQHSEVSNNGNMQLQFDPRLHFRPSDLESSFPPTSSTGTAYASFSVPASAPLSYSSPLESDQACSNGLGSLVPPDTYVQSMKKEDFDFLTGGTFASTKSNTNDGDSSSLLLTSNDRNGEQNPSGLEFDQLPHHYDEHQMNQVNHNPVGMGELTGERRHSNLSSTSLFNFGNDDIMQELLA